MSILIKGMQMPKSCNECILSIDEACMVKNEIISDYWARLDRLSDCPLIELPPHGRLIDIDRLLLEVNNLINSEKGILQIVSETEKLIRNAPTIIEAEAKE